MSTILNYFSLAPLFLSILLLAVQIPKYKKKIVKKSEIILSFIFFLTMIFQVVLIHYLKF